MPVIINLRDLEDGEKSLHIEGELTPEQLELTGLDELVEVTHPLHYQAEVELHPESLHLHGTVSLPVKCECSRCLKPFNHTILLDPYHLFLPLVGEDAITVENDMVDLAPLFREDALLAFPQHPLCSEDCRGLPGAPGLTKALDGPPPGSENSSAWAALNKLKF